MKRNQKFETATGYAFIDYSYVASIDPPSEHGARHFGLCGRSEGALNGWLDQGVP